MNFELNNFVWNGVLNLSPWGLVIYTAIVTFLTILTVTIYLHRTGAHLALKLHAWVQHAFRAWLWLTTGMRTKEWVAIHRKHHATVDTENDPHSPIWKGKWNFLWKGVGYYVVAARDQETMEKYGHGTPDDWIERNLYTPHNFLGVGVLLGLINVILFGLPGLLVWGVQAIWIPLFAAGIINGWGHFVGYQNYKRGDPRYPNVEYSTNIFWWGILIGGEELHNNHHADGTSPFFAHRWFEFDVGGLVVKILCLLRLAELRKPLVPKNLFERMYLRFFNLSAA